MGVGGQHHAPAALPPGKTGYPLYRRLGGPQCWSRRVRKISPPLGFDSQTVQPVASSYTDWAILAHHISRKPFLNQPEANFRIMFASMILCNYTQSIKNESTMQWVNLYKCSNSEPLTHHTHTYWEANVLDVKHFSITVYKSCSDLTVLTSHNHTPHEV